MAAVDAVNAATATDEAVCFVGSGWRVDLRSDMACAATPIW